MYALNKTLIFSRPLDCKTGFSRPSGSSTCYPNCPTGYTMQTDGSCTAPNCSSNPSKPYLCGTTCVKNAKNCASGVPTVKDPIRGICPGDMITCRVSGRGMGMGGWECVDVKSDIESCKSSLIHSLLRLFCSATLLYSPLFTDYSLEPLHC
jgi:hypothetical protein